VKVIRKEGTMEKLVDTFKSASQAWRQIHTPVIPVTQGVEIRRLEVQTKTLGPYLKNHWSKKGRGVVQVVEHLLSKHKALSRNPVLPKKIKK
jgi:hypothetical protein